MSRSAISTQGAEIESRYNVVLPELPKSWTYRHFQDILDVQGGSQPPKSTFVFEPTPGFVQLLQIRDFGDRGVPTFVREDLITKRCEEEDILIARYGASLGRMVTGQAGAYNVALAKVIFDKSVFSGKCLYYLLQTPFFQTPLHMISRSAQNGFNKGDLSDIVLPVAPLNEQGRIVAKIEELFSDLDAGVAALKRAKANLKRYRASVLKAAVEGKLNEQLRHDSFKNSNWIEIGTLLTCVEQGWSPKCEREPSSSDDEWAVMKTSAVLPMQFLEHENKRLPISLAPETQFEVQVGDLLITRAGPRNRAAVTCLVRSSRPRLIVCDKVYRIRCNHKQVIPAYLEIALNSPQILDELDDMKTGISDSGVNLTQQKFRRLKIPVPPLQSQRHIVDEVEERLSVAAVAELEINKSLLRASRLRQSILKQAFEGKLVPQDPKDEPASALLERLRASRAHDEANGTAATSKRTRAKLKESSGEPRTRIRRGPSSQNQQEE